MSRRASGVGRRRVRAGVSSSGSGAFNGAAGSSCRCSDGRERGRRPVTWPVWTGGRRSAGGGFLQDRGEVQRACLALAHAQAHGGLEPMAGGQPFMIIPAVSEVEKKKRERERAPV